MLRSRLARALALLLGVTSLVVVATSTQAGAVVKPCTMTFVGQGFALNRAEYRPNPTTGVQELHAGWSGWNLTLADDRVVTDIDVTLDVYHPDASQLHAFLYKDNAWSPQVQMVGTGMATGVMDGSYTFDDEARGTKITGTSPPPGRYLPNSPANRLEGTTARSTWSIWVNNWSPQVVGNVRSLAITMTFATCDSDGDGVEDHVDNCSHAPNGDQANLDADNLGDACDPDRDGDLVTDTTDACPTLAATTTNGCPTAGRTARLVHKKKKRRLLVTVASTHPACRTSTRVRLRRTHKGRTTTTKTFTTTRAGKKKLKAPRRPGRYFLQVTSNHVTAQVDCGPARSKKIRIRR